MKHTVTNTINVYSIQPSKNWPARHWQAEWDDCDFAPRSHSKDRCYRKAVKWKRWDAKGRPFGLVWVQWKLERLWWSL